MWFWCIAVTGSFSLQKLWSDEHPDGGLHDERHLVHCGIRVHICDQPEPFSLWACLTLATPQEGTCHTSLITPDTVLSTAVRIRLLYRSTISVQKAESLYSIFDDLINLHNANEFDLADLYIEYSWVILNSKRWWRWWTKRNIVSVHKC